MPRAAWILPSYIENSGGFRTIFQNIECLIQHGFQCDVYTARRGQAKNPSELKKIVEGYFGIYGCCYYVGYGLQSRYDIVFATSWKTVEIVKKYNHAAKKAYLIQDFEASFYPVGSEYLSACNSYCQGLYPITIGKWLAGKMIREYHACAQYFDFCADGNIYQNLYKNKRREKAVCFIYQPYKPRRCSDIGLRALGIMHYLRPDVKIYLYGSDKKPRVSFAYEHLGNISIQQCNELYNRCMAGLCISATNPSRIPFEMMAAGLPVVDLYLENNLYDMPQEGVLLAHYTPQSIAAALLAILDDSELAKRMSECGQHDVANRMLQHGYEQFYQAVVNILSDDVPECKESDKLYKKAPVYGEVVENKISPKILHDLNSRTMKPALTERLKQMRCLRNNRMIRQMYGQIRGY